MPLPLTTKTDWHNPLGNKWTGNASQMKVVTDGKYGAEMLYAEWKDGEKAPVVEVTSRFATRDRAVDLWRKPGECAQADGGRASSSTPPSTDLHPDRRHRARDRARYHQGRQETDVEKARAIYEWIVDNTFRDPKVRGCGWGDIKTHARDRAISAASAAT